MILYGSQTSPFVRRLRLLLPESAYEFRKTDIFNPNERQQLLKISPLLKIPILQIEEQTIWDSRVIFTELCRRGFHRSLSLSDENLLTAMSDLSDSLVQKLLANRSKVEFPQNTPIEVSHRERIENTLTYLVKRLESGDFAQWDFLSMCLYAIVDWTDFRSLANLTTYSQLLQFRDQHRGQPRVALTDPRLN